MFRIACGPFTIEWSVADPVMAEALLAHGDHHQTGLSADLRIAVETSLPVNKREARRLLPVSMTDGDSAGVIDVQLGNVAHARWSVADSQMRCTCIANANPLAAAALLESLCSQLVAAWLPSRGGTLLHACGIITNGTTDLFVGPSGAGKSTVARSVSPDRVVHDDILLLVRRRGVLQISQVPWRYNGWMRRVGTHWPVGRVFLLARDGWCSGVERMPAIGALSALCQDSHFWFTPQSRIYQQQLGLLSLLVTQHPCYRLRYRLHHDDLWQDIADMPSTICGRIPVPLVR